MARGKRESQWLTLRRCLAIIRRVQQGPTDWEGLVAAVLAQEGEEAYGRATGAPLRKRLHRDLTRIRQSLRLEIKADRKSGEYYLQETGLPLLDLPETDLETIAWLEQIFNPSSPRYREVQALSRRLQSYLAPDRRQIIEQYRTGLILDLGQRDEDRILPDVERGLTEALIRRRQVEFDYLSPRYEDGQSRRHVVDFFEPVYFDTERGHHYVYGWCHYAVGPAGQDSVEDYVLYRLGRMSNLRLLPQKLPSSPPTPKQYPVIYWLSADIARYGVSYRRWINIDRVEPQADGSVIYGATANLFLAVQELMHYRHKCRVLGGPEMLKRMTATIQKMAQRYNPDH